jgi:very-short-patch-repair endonuclease
MKELSITTVELAKRIRRHHNHVMRDTEKMLTRLYGKEELKFFKETYIDTRNKVQPCYRLFKHEICSYLNSMRNTKNSENINNLCKELGINVNNVCIPSRRKEFKFGEEIVKNLFSDYKIIPQFQVQDYRIDWYIPELKIAIEFDENHHCGPNSKRDKRRQKEIEKLLGCRFIRYTDK